MNWITALAVVCVIAGLALSAVFQMPQAGFQTFAAGIVLIAVSFVMRQFAASKGANRGLAWGSVGFLMVAMAQIGAAVGLLPAVFSTVLTGVGGTLMVAGILVHLKSIGNKQ